jgi:MtN3 and saliva related transmembrane protein
MAGEFDAVVAALGIVAAVLVASSFVPQIKRGLATRSMEDVSAYLVIMLICGFVLWAAYGVFRNDWIITGSNIVSASLNVALLAMKFRYRR